MKLTITVIQQSPVVIAVVQASSDHVQPNGGEQQHRGPSVEQVLSAAVGCGIDRVRYVRYAAVRWGPDWAFHADCRREALDQIERYCRDPEGLVDKVEVELRGAARTEVIRR